MLAFFQALMLELAHPPPGDTTSWSDVAAPRWTHAAALLGMASLYTWALTDVSPEWRSFLSQRWGSPHAWLNTVFLAAAAAILAVAVLTRRTGARSTSLYWGAVSLLLGWLAVGEGMQTCRYRFTHIFVDGDFPARLRKTVDVLHDPIEWPTVATVALLFVVAAAGWRVLPRWPRAAMWLGLGAVLVLGAIGVNGYLEDAFTDGFGESYGSPPLRALGSTSLVLGALAVFVGPQATCRDPASNE